MRHSRTKKLPGHKKEAMVMAMHVVNNLETINLLIR